MERYRSAFERININPRATVAFASLEVFRYIQATDFTPWLKQTRRAEFIPSVLCGLRARLSNWSPLKTNQELTRPTSRMPGGLQLKRRRCRELADTLRRSRSELSKLAT